MKSRIKLTFVVLAVAFHLIAGKGLFPASLNRGKPLGLLTMHAEQLQELSPPIKFLPSMSFSNKPFFPSMQLPLMPLPTIPEEDEEVEAAESEFSIPQFPFEVPFTLPELPVTNKPQNDKDDTNLTSIPNTPPSDSYVLNMVDPELPTLEPEKSEIDEIYDDTSDDIDLFEVPAIVESIDNFDDFTIIEEQNVSPDEENISDVDLSDSITVPEEEVTNETEESENPQDISDDSIENNSETIIQVIPENLDTDLDSLTVENTEDAPESEGLELMDSEYLLVQGINSPLMNNQSEPITSELGDMENIDNKTSISTEDIQTPIENITLDESIVISENSSQAEQLEPMNLFNNVNGSDIEPLQTIQLVDGNITNSNDDNSTLVESIPINNENENNVTESILNDIETQNSTTSVSEEDNTTNGLIDEITPVDVEIESSQPDAVTETNGNNTNINISQNETIIEGIDNISTVELDPKTGEEEDKDNLEPEEIEESGSDAQNILAVSPTDVDDNSTVQVIPLNASISEESQSSKISETNSVITDNKLLNETIIQNPITEIDINNTTNINRDTAFQDSSDNITVIDSESIINEDSDISNNTVEIISDDLTISGLSPEIMSNFTEISEIKPEESEILVDQSENKTLTELDTNENEINNMEETKENLEQTLLIDENTFNASLSEENLIELLDVDVIATNTSDNSSNDTFISPSNLLLESNNTVENNLEKETIDMSFEVPLSDEKQVIVEEEEENLNNTIQSNENQMILFEEEPMQIVLVDESENVTESYVPEESNNIEINLLDNDNVTTESNEILNTDFNQTVLNLNEQLQSSTDEIENLTEETTKNALDLENLDDQNIITNEISTNSTSEQDIETNVENNSIVNNEDIEESKQNATTTDKSDLLIEKEESVTKSTELPESYIDYNDNKNSTEDIPESINILNTTILDANETELIETSQNTENNEIDITEIKTEPDPLIEYNEDVLEFNTNETTTSDENISESIENLEETSERQIGIPNIGESLQVKVEMGSLLNNTDLESALESPLIENLSSTTSSNETTLIDETDDSNIEIIPVEDGIDSLGDYTETYMNESSIDVTVDETTTETKYEIRMFPNIPTKTNDDSDQEIEQLESDSEDIGEEPTQDIENLSFINDTDISSNETANLGEMNIIELMDNNTLVEIQNDDSDLSADMPNDIDENIILSDDSENANDEMTNPTNLENLDMIDLNLTATEIPNVFSESIVVSQNETKSTQEIENETIKPDDETTKSILENFQNTTEVGIENVNEQSLITDEKNEPEEEKYEIIEEEKYETTEDEPVSSDSQTKNEDLQLPIEENLTFKNETENNSVDEEIDNTNLNPPTDEIIISNITDIEQTSEISIVTLPVEEVTTGKPDEDITTHDIISIEEIIQNKTEVEVSELPNNVTLLSLNEESVTTPNKTESFSDDPQTEILNKIISEIPIDKEAQEVVLQKSNDISNQTVLALSPSSDDDNNSTTVTVMRMYEKLLLKYVFNGPEA